jgi:hypothetical protein
MAEPMVSDDVQHASETETGDTPDHPSVMLYSAATNTADNNPKENPAGSN